MVSAGALHAREKTLVRQLLLTAMGLVVAIGLVGALIVRQQRYAAALNERLRNAEKLQSMERQLVRAEKLATTGVLAAGIAHEVGTPLGIIRARAELLMDQLAHADGQRALARSSGRSTGSRRPSGRSSTSRGRSRWSCSASTSPRGCGRRWTCWSTASASRVEGELEIDPTAVGDRRRSRPVSAGHDQRPHERV